LIDAFKVGQHIRLDGHTYTIEQTIRGGMGLVLLCSAVEPSDSYLYCNRLATKVFSPDQDMNQIRTELRLWQRLGHPHIVRLLAIGHVNDWLCASMHWFPNGSITANEMLSLGGLAAVQTMLTQMSEALKYAMKQNILHLDIKPANILSRYNSYYLADWGIAKFSARRAINNEPATGGTVPYMAPERFLREPNGPAADIYSLGMTAFEMLTGTLPFSETSQDEMAQSIVLGRTSTRCTAPGSLDKSSHYAAGSRACSRPAEVVNGFETRGAGI